MRNEHLIMYTRTHSQSVYTFLHFIYLRWCIKLDTEKTVCPNAYYGFHSIYTRIWPRGHIVYNAISVHILSAHQISRSFCSKHKEKYYNYNTTLHTQTSSSKNWTNQIFSFLIPHHYFMCCRLFLSPKYISALIFY